MAYETQLREVIHEFKKIEKYYKSSRFQNFVRARNKEVNIVKDTWLRLPDANLK
jgi:hypothetical protein